MAEAYLGESVRTPTPGVDPVISEQPPAKRRKTGTSFLDDACSFTWATPTVNATPEEADPKAELKDEIRRYLSFHKEVAPRSSEERSKRLQGALGWWKVHLLR